MRTRRFYILGILLLVALTPQGCGFDITSPTINSVVLAKDYNNGDAVNPTTTFNPSDHIFNLVVKLGVSPDGTKVGATWYAVNAGTVQNQKLDGNEIELHNGANVAHFTLTNDRDWPSGHYKVDITLNGKADRTVEFEVQ
jgi:hypothetical protein